MVEKDEMFKRALAGLFFIGGIILIGLFVFTIGKGKGIAENKMQVPVLFKNVGGLNQGAPVRLSGVTVGTVGSIDFLNQDLEGRRVKVALNISEKYKPQLAESTRFAIRTEGILGEKLIEIFADADQPRIDLSKPIFGEDPIDVQDLAGTFTETAESFKKTAKQLEQVDMVELARVMQESSQALLQTAQGVSSVLAELEEVARKSQRLMDRVEQKIIEGDLFKVF